MTYKEIFIGAVDFSETDGYTEALRFSPEQLEYRKTKGEAQYLRALCPASVKLEFYTRGGTVSFDYKILPGVPRKYYSIDIKEDFVLKYSVSEELNEGEGSFYYEIEASETEKRITLYFPATARLLFKNLKLPCDFTPHKREKKVLVLGDSKLQGYHPDNFSNTCMNYLSDKLDCNLINHSIGGECFAPEGIFPVSFDPDFIIVGYGINDWVCRVFGNGENAKAYYEKVSHTFPGKRIFGIIPSRNPYLEKGGKNEDALYEKTEEKGEQTLEDVRLILEKIISETENAVVIDGRGFIPDEPGIFYPDKVHLTDKGNIIYGEKIYEIIKEYI